MSKDFGRNKHPSIDEIPSIKANKPFSLSFILLFLSLARDRKDSSDVQDLMEVPVCVVWSEMVVQSDLWEPEEEVDKMVTLDQRDHPDHQVYPDHQETDIPEYRRVLDKWDP